jgi:hypothetical protein
MCRQQVNRIPSHLAKLRRTRGARNYSHNFTLLYVYDKLYLTTPARLITLKVPMLGNTSTRNRNINLKDFYFNVSVRKLHVAHSTRGLEPHNSSLGNTGKFGKLYSVYPALLSYWAALGAERSVLPGYYTTNSQPQVNHNGC